MLTSGSGCLEFPSFYVESQKFKEMTSIKYKILVVGVSSYHDLINMHEHP